MLNLINITKYISIKKIVQFENEHLNKEFQESMFSSNLNKIENWSKKTEKQRNLIKMQLYNNLSLAKVQNILFFNSNDPSTLARRPRTG